MGLIKPLLWWAYVDDKGRIEVKMYKDDHSIRNYEMLPFVKGIFDPFYAWDLQEAKKIVYEKYQDVKYYEKKEQTK